MSNTTAITEKNNINKNMNNSEIIFKSGDPSKEFKLYIIEAFKKSVTISSLMEVCKSVKEYLDKKYLKGWMVFASDNITGAFTHINGTLCELQYNNNIFIIFKTYYPES